MPKQEPGRGREFSWRRALAVWLLIVVLESAQGVLRQLYLVPVLGDLQSRQLGLPASKVMTIRQLQNLLQQAEGALFVMKSDPDSDQVAEWLTRQILDDLVEQFFPA